MSIFLPIVVLFNELATRFATFLSLNSTHPSVKVFLPLPPDFFLFFLTVGSIKQQRIKNMWMILSSIWTRSNDKIRTFWLEEKPPYFSILREYMSNFRWLHKRRQSTEIYDPWLTFFSLVLLLFCVRHFVFLLAESDWKWIHRTPNLIILFYHNYLFYI